MVIIKYWRTSVSGHSGVKRDKRYKIFRDGILYILQ